jgi:TolA-binding protein
MKKKIFLLASSFCTVLYAYETSAFGAGDLDNSSPYGLTDTEKYIYENKKTISNNEKFLNNLTDDVEALKIKYLEQNTAISGVKESMIGLQSIVDTEGQKVHKQMLKLMNLNTTLEKLSQTDKNFDAKIKSVIEDNNKALKELKTDYNANIDKFKKIVNDLSISVKKIEDSYETKQNVEILRQDFIHFTKTYKNSILLDVENRLARMEKNQAELKLQFEDSDTLFKKANDFYKAKNYQESIKRLEILEKRDYKKPEVYFMLGESSFYSSNYNNAMYYYKNSMNLDDKASYLSKLLYHTGISCIKLGDKAKSKIFFRAVVEQFPNSNEAKLSSKYVKPVTKDVETNSNSVDSNNTKK